MSTDVVLSALRCSTFMLSIQGALPALMPEIAPLVSAIVVGSRVISSIISMLLATWSGLGLFSISSKCSFHLCRTYNSFFNNLLVLFLTMSILLGGSIAAQSLCGLVYTFYLHAMSYAVSPFSFARLDTFL